MIIHERRRNDKRDRGKMKVSNGIKKILSDRREVPSRRDLDGNFFTMWRERVYI